MKCRFCGQPCASGECDRCTNKAKRAPRAGIKRLSLPACEKCGEDFDDTENDVPGHCAGCASKCDCGETVYKDDQYFATPCGTICDACMGEHAKECGVCASEFGLTPEEHEDGKD